MRTPDEPTIHTRSLHRQALHDRTFDWDDRRDFDWAARGLIHRPDDPYILDDAGDIAWHHYRFEAFLHGDAPVTVHPSLWRHALLNNHRGLFKVCEGIYQVRGESLANVTFVRGETGWIVIDPLTTVEVARYAVELLCKHVSRRPIKAVIYSHTHSDHFGGVKGMVSEADVASGKVRVIAPTGFTEWVLKEQGLAAEGMPSRNAYMYGENLEVSVTGIVDTGLGQAIEGGAVSFIEPTDIIPPEGARLTIDGVEMEFMHAPGEAPTGIHTYFPAHRTLHCADNCYMCLHNVYTIRGAFPRDAMAWADSVSRSLAFTEGSYETEHLVSGHNWPVFGADEIRTFLTQQRDGIRYMHDQTLRLMSLGHVPAEIANLIEFPPSLDRLWHLRGYYGTLKHNVRGIYAYYLGWYDGNPAHLDELPPREVAGRTIHYMGGVDNVLARAKTDMEAGEYRWVAHVLDHVLWLEPHNAEARELAARAHTQLGYQAENATWRNAYLGAAQELRNGLPEPKNARLLRDVLKGMEPLALMNALSVRLNGPAAAGAELAVTWQMTDAVVAASAAAEGHSAATCHTTLRNAVLHHGPGPHPEPDVTVSLKREQLSELAIGQLSLSELLDGGAAIDGDDAGLRQLFAMLDDFPPWFPVASHDLKQGEGA